MIKQSSSTPNATQILQSAVQKHQAGDVGTAQALYLSILQSQPDHPEANHNLGVLALQDNQHQISLAYFMTALNADPAQRQYWISYIDALILADLREEAQSILTFARQQGLQGNEVDALDARINQAVELPSPHTSRLTSKKTGAKKLKTPSTQEINSLVSLFSSGNFTEAENRARSMTEHYPAHWVGWKMLGVIFQQQGKNSEALMPALTASKLSPNDAETHNNLGIILDSLGRPTEACVSYRKALTLNPNYIQAHSNLGATLQKSGHMKEAATSYQKALALNPGYAKAHNNLGAVLSEMGEFQLAAASFKRALHIQPDNAQAHYNLSIVQKKMGAASDAIDSCRAALQINPDDADAHYNMGTILFDLNHLSEAEAAFRQALRCQPESTDTLNHLALLLNAQKNPIAALEVISRSLKIQETIEAKSIYITCVKDLPPSQADATIRANLVRALTEPWGNTSEMAMVCIRHAKYTRYLSNLIVRAKNAEALSIVRRIDSEDLASLEKDSLLTALLCSAPICDTDLERLMTLVRRDLLTAAVEMTTPSSDDTLRFYSALARQCFINEYVFSYSDAEIQTAQRLRASLAESLKENIPTDALCILAVAAYFPLHTIDGNSQLLNRCWPVEVCAVLIQQIQEPKVELQLRNTLAKLGRIENTVSLQVQNQYEENPYPRWIKVPPPGDEKNIKQAILQKFPQTHFSRQKANSADRILIAGCGTGQHSISLAQRTRDAQILAIDLSTSSLAYAKRKTLELGISSIEYAQADLLEIAHDKRRFEMIQSSGVLHHMKDPWAGWQALLTVLKPGGFMKLGLYSELARTDVVRIRDFIAQQGYGSTADEIRRCRQELININEQENFGAILNSPDFYSISACRDLLFHVQEHRMTLSGIGAFIRSNKLKFLGFEIDSEVLRAYKQRFPNDPEAIHLEQWHIFETENPHIFASMYQFWIQKPEH
ncbi:MAG: tetratricopeptide repeat protein [Gallionella sp.]